ncbi:unnamed protein product [Adineta steineri]|uniref:Uncharacterized protein n=1 Tax=Adineta steineri TaxID=433720 RepID=A0A818N9A3_9BILA|nr:unnamed protein product [Adineta steineri]CAF3601737.1 unnamed protein product [Adineta steineri]
MDPNSFEGYNETAPLRNGSRTSAYLPVDTASRTFGTSYFLISTLLASIIPLVELGIGLHYKGECPIDQRIPTYMIVAGVCGLVLVGLSIFLAVTFMCFIPDSTALTLVASCGVCLNVFATLVVSIFVFIWFILGCIWVFSIRKEVQFIIPLTPNYCNPVLYKWTFALLILTIVWAFLQCCISCIRQCCFGRSE